MAAYVLSEGGVTGIATANPSTFLRLLTLINDQPDALLDAVATGRLPDASFRPALEARPERAASLRSRLREAGRLTYADIWPRLDGIVTWTGGSCGAALGKLTPLLAEGDARHRVGLLGQRVPGGRSTSISTPTPVCPR